MSASARSLYHFLRSRTGHPWLMVGGMQLVFVLVIILTYQGRTVFSGDADSMGVIPHLLYEIVNLIIAGAYFAISSLIAGGLIRHKQLGRANPLGTATAMIFLTCGVGHLAHVIHAHFAPIAYLLILIDTITAAVASSYWALRRNYGVLMGDIAHLYDVRRRLAETTQLNQAILEAVADGIIFYNAEGRIVRTNSKVQQITNGVDLVGIDHHELLAHPQRYFRFPILFEFDFDEVFPRVLAGETLRDLRARLYTPARRTISITYNRVLDPDGKPAGVVATLHDITAALDVEALRVRQEATEAERQHLQTVIDQLPEGVLIVDPQGSIVLANQLARTVFAPGDSTPLTEIEPRLQYRYPDGRPFPPDQMPLQRALATGQAVDMAEFVVAAPNGQNVHLLVNAAPLTDTSGQLSGAVAVFQDIRSLREVERMKDEFLSIASHELRTPVTAIKGFAQLLARDLAKQGANERTRRSADVINHQLDHLSELINDLLDVSRIEAGRLALRPQDFDLGRLITDVTRALQVTSERHRLQAILPATPLMVRGDAERIEQVLTNLMANAIKYSPDGGPIEIDCLPWSNLNGHAPTPELPLPQGEWAVVRVRDRGIGIPPDHLTHIFDRFYRATGDHHFGGLGLGLYISRELVQGHGGHIWAESEPGQGSIVSFALPMTSPTSGDPNPRPKLNAAAQPF